MYDKTDLLRRLDFIKKAQSLRFTLDEIKSLLSLTYPQKPCNQARALLQQKIKNIQEEIINLEKQNLFLTNISNKWGSLDDCFANDDFSNANPICELIDKV